MLITKKIHDNFVKDGVVLLDFWAPWCPPCNAITPVIEKLEREFEGKVKIGKINIDEEDDLSTKYEIAAIPAFVFLKNNQVQKMLVGIQNESDLRTWLEDLLVESESEKEASRTLQGRQTEV
jgi:thioredoxin 1